MQTRFAIRLVAAFAVLGLILAPLARPATAMPTSMQISITDQAMGDEDTAAHAAMTMPEGMPCCPDEAPVSDCGKHCLMVMCAANAVSMLPNQTWLAIPQSLSEKVAAVGDIVINGFSQPPPSKPPRA